MKNCLKERKLLSIDVWKSLTKAQLLSMGLLLFVLIIIIVSIVFFIKNILNKRRLSKTVLPNLYEEEDVVEEEEEESVFGLDFAEDEHITDQASFEIMQSIQKVQSRSGNSRGITNPFKR